MVVAVATGSIVPHAASNPNVRLASWQYHICQNGASYGLAKNQSTCNKRRPLQFLLWPLPCALGLGNQAK